MEAQRAFFPPFCSEQHLPLRAKQPAGLRLWGLFLLLLINCFHFILTPGFQVGAGDGGVVPPKPFFRSALEMPCLTLHCFPQSRSRCRNVLTGRRSSWKGRCLGGRNHIWVVDPRTEMTRQHRNIHSRRKFFKYPQEQPWVGLGVSNVLNQKRWWSAPRLESAVCKVAEDLLNVAQHSWPLKTLKDGAAARSVN